VDASATPASAAVREGRATFFDTQGQGACSLDAVAGPVLVAAVSRARYAGSAACGTCAEVRGPRGAVVVRVADVCPGCRGDDLDLSRAAFAQVADLEKGRVAVTWRAVPCAVEGPLAYRFKEGSTQWWSAVQVRNHRRPVASVAWWKKGAWVPLERRAYNYFVTRAPPGPGPVRLRITTADGQTREDTLPGVRAGQTLPGSVQFD
jgi:expansin (peptidoglycan-binding protein)